MKARLLLLAGMIVASATAEARAQSASEAELKAAYLFNFALFVEWPTRNKASFTVCQYGSDSLGSGAAALARKSLRGKTITVRQANAKELSGCDMLYIPSSEKARIRDLAQRLRGSNVLTVSDAQGAAREGATIGLSIDGQKIVFEINVAEAKRNSLVISAKLLSLAETVVDTP